MLKAISMRLFLILTVLSLLAGCTVVNLLKESRLKKPNIKYVSHELGEPTLEKVPLFLHFNAHNKNDVGLKNVFVNYELLSEGKRFLKGENIELTLVPKGDTKIIVPADIVYKDILDALGSVAEGVFSGKKTLRVLANVNVYGTPTVYSGDEEGALFSFSYSTSEVIDIPIPHNQIQNKAKESLDKLKKLF